MVAGASKGLSSERAAEQGLRHAVSPYGFAETIERLEQRLQSHGLTIFARIDHSAEASKAGLSLRPAYLLIFGNPRIGTPPMVAAPTLAIDLPSKALVWQDAEGRVQVTYNDPGYLARRHDLPDHLRENLSGITALIREALDGSK